MARSPYPSTVGYTFGPGGMTPAIRIILIACGAMFVVRLVAPSIVFLLGLSPQDVFTELRIWQPVTYIFLHDGPMHLLFNLLGIWMFGVELERLWGTQAFVRYFAVTGVGAGVCTLLVALLPFDATAPVYYTVTIGASGALYGLLYAWARLFPNRPILMFFLFPVPAKWFVIILGGMAFLIATSSTGSTVAHFTHLGGLVAGYLYLNKGGGSLVAEVRYRYLKWRMNRLRKRFDVHEGGRGRDKDRWVH